MTTSSQLPSGSFAGNREFSRAISWWREDGVHAARLVVARRSAEQLEREAPEWLGVRELTVLSGLKFAKRRADWLAGRYCAKAALVAWQGGGAARELELATGVFGQPLVRGARRAGARVGVAHAAGWGAAIAFGDEHPLGIDLEAVTPERNDVIRGQMTERELAEARAWLSTEAECLTWLWTAKEALAKTLGTGLLTPLTVYEVSGIARDGGWLTAEFVNFGQYRARTAFFAGMAFSMAGPKRSACDLDAAEISAALAEAA